MSRMHRIALVPLLLLTVAPLARSEAQSLSFGLMAGGSLSTFTGGPLADDAKNYGGFIAGGFVSASLAGLTVQPGLFYTQKGTKSTDDEAVTTTNRLNYIQVPLVVRLSLPLVPGTHLYVGGGPAIGINIGCRLKSENQNVTLDEDCESDLGTGILATPESSEMSAIGVAGIEFGKFSLGVRGDFGLNKTFSQLIGQTGKPDLKTRTISAVAAIRF